MQTRSNSLVLTHTLALALGASLLYAIDAEKRAGEAQTSITKLQAELRSSTTRLYNQQDAEADKVDVARGEGYAEAYQQCQKGLIK